MNPTVPPFAYAAVLLGAMLHAGWNVAVRRGRDRAFETALVVAGGVVLARLTLHERAPARTWAAVLLIALGAAALRLG